MASIKDDIVAEDKPLWGEFTFEYELPLYGYHEADQQIALIFGMGEGLEPDDFISPVH